LHRRMRVVEMGGDPDTQWICSHCGLRPLTRFHLKKCGRSGRYKQLDSRCKECANRRSVIAAKRRRNERRFGPAVIVRYTFGRATFGAEPV
jgi:hypothetical protein